MYACYICKKLSKPKQTLLRHVLYREVSCKPVYGRNGSKTIPTRKEIARELPICHRCKSLLDAGHSLRQLLVSLRPKPKRDRVSPAKMFPKPQRIDRTQS